MKKISSKVFSLLIVLFVFFSNQMFSKDKSNHTFTSIYQILSTDQSSSDTTLSNRYYEEALILYNEAQYNEAIEKLLLSEKILSKIVTINTDKKLIETLTKLGDCNIQKGDFVFGTQYYYKVLNFYQKESKINNNRIAKIHRKIGLAHFRNNKDKEALESFKEGLSLIKNESPSEILALIYQGIGAVYVFTKPDEGLKYQEKALEIYRSLDSLKQLASIYMDMGLSHYKMGNPEKVDLYLNKSIKVAEGINYIDLLGKVYFYAAQFEMEKNELASADSLFQHSIFYQGYKGLDSIELISVPTFLAYTINLNANIAYNRFLNNHNVSFLFEAKKHNTEALRILEYQYDLINYESRLSLSYHLHSIYEDCININYELFKIANDPNTLEGEQVNESFLKEVLKNKDQYFFDSFLSAESSKSFTLLNAMNDKKITFFDNYLPNNIINKEVSLRDSLKNLEKEIRKKITSGLSATNKEVLPLYNKRSKVINDIDSFKRQLEKDYPKYYNAKIDFSFIEVEDVQKNLLTSNQVLIEYYVGANNIFIFLILKNDFHLVKVENDFPLKEWVEDLRNGIYGNKIDPPTCSETVADSLYAHSGFKLYEKIFKPVESLFPEDVNKLILVTDDLLGYIPFEALLTETPNRIGHTNEYSFLRNKYIMSTSPSGTLLHEMINLNHKKVPAKKLLALAPYIPNSFNANYIDQNNLSVTNTRQGLSELLYSEDELTYIDEFIKGDQLKGEEASKINFLETAGNYSILHLSTHGKADDNFGNYSYLAFCPTDSIEENWKLYYGELFNLQLNADMVVLSACETGIGELKKGEGVISLARGISFAGAKSIVTTLWSVNDQSTSKFMKYFYENLNNNLPKDEAMNIAKSEFINTREYSHPYYWAGFIPIGDMQPIIMDSSNFNYKLLSLVGIALVMIILIFRLFISK